MGRMFKSGSNAQEAGFAKSRANGNMVNVPGPEPPLDAFSTSGSKVPSSTAIPPVSL